MGMGYAVGTSVATALKVVQRHRPFLAKPERKASRIVFSNEKPPPQWQKCNAHWSNPILLQFSSFVKGAATEHSAFTVHSREAF